MEPAPNLELFPPHSTLSDIATVIAGNYGKYHAVTAQMEALQEWATAIAAAPATSAPHTAGQ